MKRLSLAAVCLLMVSTSVALGQVRVRYDDGYRASTVGESHANGAARVMVAGAERNLRNSEAALNLTEVRSRELDNRLKYADTYFQRKQMNSIARFGTPEEREARRQRNLERQMRAGLKPRSKTPSASELDPITGKINWPLLLGAPDFEEYRSQLDSAFAARAKRGGHVDFEQFTLISKLTDGMLAVLKKKIRDLPPKDYMNAQAFIHSLAYVAQHGDQA